MPAVPNDPVILLSFLNTKLRDHYSSLSALCDDLEQDEAVLTGVGKIEGKKAVIAVMNSKFLMGSMVPLLLDVLLLVQMVIW